MKTIHRCCEKLYANYAYYDCGAKASVERKGKWYCKRHDPVAVAAKQAARREKYERESREREAKWDAREKRERLESEAGIPDLTDDELRAIVAAGGIRALLDGLGISQGE